MLASLVVNLLAAASVAFATDTTVAVTRGTRLELSNFEGDIRVRVWDRRAVHVEADYERGEVVRVARRGAVLSISSYSRGGPPGAVDYQITVPAGMPVSLKGVHASVVIEGLRGDVAVTTVNGEIALQGGAGLVSLSSIMGPITVSGARGRLHVNSVNGEIRLSGIDGSILAETINGAIALARVVSDSVDASTVNGSLCYDGTLQKGGRYRFASHNGNIAVGVPEGTGAVISVATQDGDVESDFPLRIKEKMGKRFQFRLGRGGAVLQLESFGGLIRLRRPGLGWVVGEPPCKDDDSDRAEKEDEK
jgi:DUF4097 and DUF4098 domain-containing protein YvlB